VVRFVIGLRSSGAGSAGRGRARPSSGIVPEWIETSARADRSFAGCTAALAREGGSALDAPPRVDIVRRGDRHWRSDGRSERMGQNRDLGPAAPAGPGNSWANVTRTGIARGVPEVYLALRDPCRATSGLWGELPTSGLSDSPVPFGREFRRHARLTTDADPHAEMPASAQYPRDQAGFGPSSDITSESARSSRLPWPTSVHAVSGA
jgi:hypothetical protein